MNKMNKTNKTYKIAFVGIGSIGSRHLKNVVQVLKKRNCDFFIDVVRRKSSGALSEELSAFVNNIYTSYEETPSDYDIVFITNPTNLHFDTIKSFSSKTKHMFIEKPVFDDVNIDINELQLSNDNIYYVACPLRYTEVIQYVKNNIDLSKAYSVRAICSSYLPDWRPNVDYRETYSASLEQGGGVSIDLIHEWDYIIYLLGLPNEIYNFRGTFSDLQITSDDLSVYIAKYDNLLAEVHLDYFGRKAIRELQLFINNDTIVVDIINSEIRFLNENKIIKFNEERNSYQIKEIENFFDIIEGKKNNENDINKALVTLKIAKEGHI